MMNYAPWAVTFGVWLAAGLTIAIYSFLYKDNPFYKMAEHIYIGVSTGYLVVIAWNDALRPLLVGPLRHPGTPNDILAIIPGILGLMMFTRYFKKLAWMRRISLAFLIGWGAGTAAPAIIQAYLIRHTGTTITPLFNPAYFSWNPMSIIFGLLVVGFFSALVYFVQTDQYTDWDRGKRRFLVGGIILSFILFFIFAVYYPQKSVDALTEAFYALVILVGVISVLFYFFYSIEHKKSLKGIAKTGVIYLMVFFGTSFGYTVMARLSLAIGRMRFIVDDWLKTTTPAQWGIALPIIAVISILLVWQERKSRAARQD